MRAFWILLALFIMSRLLVVGYSDRIVHPEECLLASSAYDIVNGMHLSFFDYKLNLHHGGYLFDSFITAFFFKILGIGFLQLKIKALLVSSLFFSATYWLLRKYFSAKSALIAGLLMLFSPASFTLNNVISFNVFMNNLLFTSVILMLTFSLMRNPTSMKLAALGLLCGLALFNYLGAGILVITSAIALWRIYRYDLKAYLLYLASFLTGMIPLIANNMYYSLIVPSQVSDIMGNIFSADLDTLFTQANYGLDLLVSYVPSMFMLGSSAWGIIGSFVYLIAWIAGTALLLHVSIAKKSRRWEAAIIVAYLLFFVFFFAKAQLPTYYTYTDLWDTRTVIAHEKILQLYPVFFIAIPLLLAHIRKRSAALFISLLSIILLIGVLANAAILIPDPEMPEQPLFCFGTLGITVGQSYQDSKLLDEKCNALLNSDYVSGCYNGAGQEVMIRKKSIIEADTFCSSIDEKYAGDCYEGVGMTLGGDPSTAEAYCRRANETYFGDCLRGVGRELLNAATLPEERDELCNRFISGDNVRYCQET